VIIGTVTAVVELIAKQVVIETSTRAGHRDVAVRGIECSAIGSDAEFRGRSRAGASPDLDDAGHGIGAIERALRASYEFQAVGFSERNDAEVDCSPGIVNGDIVHNDLVVARVSAAHKQRGNSASSSIGVHDG